MWGLYVFMAPRGQLTTIFGCIAQNWFWKIPQGAPSHPEWFQGFSRFCGLFLHPSAKHLAWYGHSILLVWDLAWWKLCGPGLLRIKSNALKQQRPGVKLWPLTISSCVLNYFRWIRNTCFTDKCKNALLHLTNDMVSFGIMNYTLSPFLHCDPPHGALRTLRLPCLSEGATRPNL